MDKCGIYSIINLCNGKRYIGQSVRINTRMQCHLFSLMEGKHPNKHLQSAFNSYGSDNFVGEIIELCERDKLQDAEQKWIDHYGFENLYNLAPSSKSTAGVKLSDESRKRISEAHKGKKRGPLSEETKKKISEAQKARWAKRKAAQE
jgi:group I intron endonuclease